MTLLFQIYSRKEDSWHFFHDLICNHSVQPVFNYIQPPVHCALAVVSWNILNFRREGSKTEPLCLLTNLDCFRAQLWGLEHAVSEYFNNPWHDDSILGSDTRISFRQDFFQCHNFNQLELFFILFNLPKSRILPFIGKSAFHCIDRTLCPWLSGSRREAGSLFYCRHWVSWGLKYQQVCFKHERPET